MQMFCSLFALDVLFTLARLWPLALRENKLHSLCGHEAAEQVEARDATQSRPPTSILFFPALLTFALNVRFVVWEFSIKCLTLSLACICRVEILSGVVVVVVVSSEVSSCPRKWRLLLEASSAKIAPRTPNPLDRPQQTYACAPARSLANLLGAIGEPRAKWIPSGGASMRPHTYSILVPHPINGSNHKRRTEVPLSARGKK